MSTAPRGGILYRYVPGTGRVAATECTGTSPTATCASVYSTADQTLTAGTAANVAFDGVFFTYGITITTGATARFTVGSDGVYKIIPSVQYLSAGNGSVTIWLKVNGTNVDNSSTYTLAKNNEEGVITTEYLLELKNGDNVQVWALAGAANSVVNYIAAGGAGANAYPAAPGVIINMYRIR